jgi:hypothetical protein
MSAPGRKVRCNWRRRGGKFEELTVDMAGVSEAADRRCFADSLMHR